jgi:hypothetical protein
MVDRYSFHYMPVNFRVFIAYAQILDGIFVSTTHAKKLDDMSHTEHKFLYKLS